MMGGSEQSTRWTQYPGTTYKDVIYSEKWVLEEDNLLTPNNLKLELFIQIKENQIP